MTLLAFAAESRAAPVGRPLPVAVDRYLPPAGLTAANPPHAAPAGQDFTDGHSIVTQTVPHALRQLNILIRDIAYNTENKNLWNCHPAWLITPRWKAARLQEITLASDTTTKDTCHFQFLICSNHTSTLHSFRDNNTYLRVYVMRAILNTEQPFVWVTTVESSTFPIFLYKHTVAN